MTFHAMLTMTFKRTILNLFRPQTLLALGAATAIPATSLSAEWTPLFDGETLAGWEQLNGTATYEVQDGAIVGTTVTGSPNSFLCTKKTYRDFILELEFKVDPRMNSGVQIRSESRPDFKNGRVHGYQVEIDPSDRAWTGGIYDEARRGWLNPLENQPEAQKAFKNGEWNHFRIVAMGDHIRTWVNGIAAADLYDGMTPEGFIALQVHSSRTAGTQIKWRNIRLQDLSVPKAVSRDKLKALLIDGQNNHDWKACQPVLKQILEDSGRFTVDVATTPAGGEPMNGFRPRFADYDVLISNYTGDEWPEPTQTDFVDYIQQGGGLVLVHAADNAFPQWPEFNEIIGLGGWGGRNEKSGPYLYLQDGKIIRDTTPGGGGAHGQQVAYVLKALQPEHPILKGLPTEWLHVKDELYSRLRGPAKNIQVLATSRQDKDTGGSGLDEPALFTIRYGDGRIFHDVLGHAAEQMDCVGFIITLVRGAEWAATGTVTLTEVPSDFPTRDQVSRRTLTQAHFDAIRNWDFGKSRKPLAEVEAALRGMPAGGYPSVEAGLIPLLDDPNVSGAAKQFICRVLRRIGSAQSVPALARLLTDPALSHLARFALQHMPAPEAGSALLQALPNVSGELKIGLVGSLGQRADSAAVPELGKLIDDTHRPLARAAIIALGEIGTHAAAEVMLHKAVEPSLGTVRDDALLRCADNLLAEGRDELAVRVYRGFTPPAPGRALATRLAAYRGMARATGADAVPVVLELFENEEPLLQRLAGKLVLETPGVEATRAFSERLPELEPAAQTVLIGALETRGDTLAGPAVADLVRSDDPQVNLAAIKALGVLGGPQDVPMLTDVAADQRLRGAALDSLSRLPSNGVDDTLLDVVGGTAADDARVIAIQALVRRNNTTCVPTLLHVAAEDPGPVRTDALRALRTQASGEHIPALIDLLLHASDTASRNDVRTSLAAVLARETNPSAEPLAQALDRTASDEVKASLISLLPLIGNDHAQEWVTVTLHSNQGALRKAAVRALSDWPTPAPLPELLRLARADADNHVLALRGYLKLVELPANRANRETVQMLEEAMNIAQRPEEKKAILALLPNHPCAEGLALAEAAQADDSLVAEAKLAASQVQEILVNKQLSGRASINNQDAKNAYDGNRNTRWATNRPMQPGDTYIIDIGAKSAIKGVTLDAAGSTGDYPRGYEVYVSFDGGKWNGPIVSGKGTKPLTDIPFPEAVDGRYVKIVQTGEVPGLYWSIHDLKVHCE